MNLQQMRDKVQRMLIAEFGSISIDSDSDFSIDFGTARTFITVFQTASDALMVRVFALVLSELPLTDALYRWVATDGQDFYFGRSQLLERDDGQGLLMFEHHFLGECLDPDELEFAVKGMGSVADNLGTELQPKFGGVRFNEP
jgi:hypothetical protein